MRSSLSVVAVLIISSSIPLVAQEILRPPESTTVFLNRSSVFTCETRGGITVWLVNGTQRATFLPDILRYLVISEITTPEGVLVANLTIPARAQYNGTRVQCLSVIIDVSFVESDNVTLTIQGPLSAVGDLKAISKNASSLTISWSAPFSLDVTGVDPDIWFSVLIYNVQVHLNELAVFTCETRGGASVWVVNGMLLEELEQSSPELHADISTVANVSGGMTMEKLTILAKAQYNETAFQCAVFSFGGSALSENATLKIQGPLSAVGDLSDTNNASSVTISWSAPFSLDVTGVDPDIWYSVLIYNVTDENNPTAILCTDCINITETHYTFTPECFNKYNISVVPINGAGQGETSGSLT
ncbi:hypothetical protein GBAR_LOCUS26247 [Geodia barretti]|uniref:Fibronectin type-III domain-containing protein n=1 Tax=Geodia barretti TaxID=519541 RepID=A0AA35TH42_GEOBA|nr:hypothetical protein GBAR_LOCUS26247 [Geodia barretti]